MLNCSYNLKMRHLEAYIPEYPVGRADDIAKMIADFVPVARAVIGVRNLKIITFGPRPQDFFACNAPIKGLYELGVEIEENSELDLLVAYKEHENDPRIPEVCADMAKEMGEGRYYADLSERMAQFELTLLDWAEAHKGARKYVAFADKCWPAFPSQFGFEPCYVNSRLASRGIPVSCEVDIYGALSEYIGLCISQDAVTLLDINNSVPQYIYDEDIKGRYDYKLTDTFMGFHCGNTPACKMCESRAVKYQLIQHRLLEPAGSEPDFTRGTLEGDIAASDITFYRLQCNSEGELVSYVAEGEQDLSQTLQEELLREISLLLILHSIVCSATLKENWFPMLQKVKFLMYLQDPSAVSAFSQSRRWEDSTVTFSSRATSRIMAQLCLDTTEKHSMK
ncbi:l-fucose isomerase and related proteins [Ruminococcus sp. CAG:60]|nr:l-fucose isomerase and related proteins [Ruminococcus sp. CAG:60]